MADRKISDLTALTTPATGDLLPIVDVSEAAAADKNKSITVQELFKGVPDGTAAAPGLAFESDDGNGIYKPGTDQVAISTGGTGRLFIDSSGRVGVGTTSPGANVDIANSSTSVLRLSNTDTGLDANQKTASIEFWTNDADAPNKVFAEIYGEYQFVNGYAHNLTYKGYQHIFNRVTGFDGSTSESLRIDGSGRVGVGTSSPAETLSLYTASGPTSMRFGVVDANDFLVKNEGTNNLKISSPSTDFVTITSSGNVGVGTTSPQQELHVNSSGGSYVMITTTNTGSNSGVLFGDSDDNDIGSVIYENANDALKFYTNTQERLRIDSSGRVGIGTSSPGQQMVVRGSQPFLEIRDSRQGNWDADDVFSGILFGTDDTTTSVDPHAFIKAVHTRAGTGHTAADAGLTFGCSESTSAPAIERMRLTYDGKLGIGTTSPGSKLHLSGGAENVLLETTNSSGDAFFGIRNGSYGLLGAGDAYIYRSGGDIALLADGASDVIKFASGGNTERARIDSSGRLLVGTSSASGSARIQAVNTGTAATSGNLTLTTIGASGGNAPNAPYAVTRAVYGSACTSGGTETIRTLASREIAFIKIFYSWPSGSPEWKTGAYDYNGTTVSTTWFHQSNSGHAFTLGVSGGALTLTQSVGVTMNMVIEIEYIDSSGLD